MKKCFLLAALLLTAGHAMAQSADVFTPYKQTTLRLPSVPLLTNDPYFSFWSPFDRLNDGSVRHWTDAEKPIDGLLRVDGTSYRWMGDGQSFLLDPIAPMSDAGDSWTGRVSHTYQQNTSWTQRSFNDASWKEEKAAWGTRGEYPNVRNDWTATNSDIYVRRHVTLTAEDLEKDLWVQFSHDDVFELYVNGMQVVSTGETWLQGETHQLTAQEKSKLVVGDNVLAAHCHNTSGGAYVDFGLFENVFQSGADVKKATQKSVDVMATSTYYTFACGPVELDVVFTAPMIITDLDLLSTPINYISYQVRPTDGGQHDVQFYVATTPRLCVNEPAQAVDAAIVSDGDITYARAGSTAQPVLQRAGDLICIDWGYLYLPAVNGTVSVAPTATTESTFTTTGRLPEYGGEVKNQSPCYMTTLAYVHDFGTVSDAASSYMMVGYDEVKDIRYFQKDYPGYWARNGKTIFKAFQELRDGYTDIMQRCREQDQTIYDDGLKSGNVKYAELLAASYRQVLAAHKLFEDDGGRLLYFSKENNSNGCVNTVDLTYPSAPLFLLYNTELQKGMMTSILEYQRTGRWNKDWAAHDLGTYPHANGQVYVGDMPLEESGNILTLAAMISKIEGSTAWANTYWSILTRWVNYLISNGQDPAEQLCTDDFAGHWAHNANLSVKAIMGIAGYAEMCRMRGREDQYERYMNIARKMAQIWEIDARDGDHYKLAFDRGGSWSLKYNLVWDKLWGLQLFPRQVMEREMKYYLTKQNRYGVPLDNREGYTKSDWVIWTAAMADDAETFLKFSDPLWRYVNETRTRWPISDWYWTQSGEAKGFRARSVIGGHWMRVLVDRYAPKADSTTTAWAPQGSKIKTRWAADVDPERPLPDYPRPQLVRSEWENLNGLWQYAITPQTQRQIPTEWDGQILVPFAVESSLSGVMRMLDKNNYLWYRRTFTVPEDWAGRRVMLNFGGVDYTARVYVNGSSVGSHTGGFTSFALDITDRLKEGENTLVVMVQDNTDEATQPLGKQRYNPGGAGSIWYTQVSGIWQTVWLEPVSANHITDVRPTPDVDQSRLSINVATSTESTTARVLLTLSLKGNVVAEATGQPGSDIVLNVPNARLWTPASPTLYDLSVELSDGGQTLDQARSYAALRKISYAKTADGEWRLQLNNRDLFHFGLLDQGYWPDGLYTAPTDEALRFDIEQTKALGFNMIRKHMKVEPQRWYYLCDSLGVMVWQDMPALGRSDEGWTPRDWSTKNGSQSTAVENAFRSQWADIIRQHYASPSIVVWTPFNESWGQFKTADIVSFTREQDPTRLVNPASGGNHYEGVGDMLDLHDYDRPPHIYLYDQERPVVLGEFGGLGRNIEGHRWYDRDATTYVNYQSEGQLTNAYVETVEAVIDMAQGAQTTDGRPAAFCAAVYTQTTDVETEVNGLYTYDRSLLKMTEKRVREVNERLSGLYGNAEPDAIRDASLCPTDGHPARVYSLMGMLVDEPQPGVNIVVGQHGEVRKVYVR